MKNILPTILLSFCLIIGCTSLTVYTTTDDFTGTTIHNGNISSSSGLIGGLLILKAERQVTTEMQESFFGHIPSGCALNSRMVWKDWVDA